MSAKTRATASLVLAIVGAALALVGGILLYAREEIFDSDAFANNAAKTLGDDQVRAALAEPITEQAIDRGPDALINIRPLLTAGVEGVLDSSPFREAFRHGARKLHRAIFSKDRDQVAFTVSDANVLVAQAVTALSPKAGKQIPQDLGDRLVKVSDNDTVLTVVRASEKVRLLGIVLPILAVLCLAGSVALERDRRRGVLNISVAIAVAAALAFGILLIAKGILLSGFHDTTVHDAVEAVWNVYFGRLFVWVLLIGLVAVLVAAGAAMARERDPVAPARRALAAITGTPPTPLARAGRAAGIGAAGLLLVFDPDAALRLAAVLVGAYALFFASCELLGLIAPPAEERPHWSRPSARGLTAAAAVAAVVVVGIMVVSSGHEAGRAVARPPGGVTNCNGYPQLCDKPLNEVAFPAAHNAMSSAQLTGWFQPNQRFDMRRQLNDGVRALLIDTHYGIKEPDGQVFTDLSREDRNKVLEAAREQLGEEGAAAFQRLSSRLSGSGGKQGFYLCHVVCELGSINLVTSLEQVREFMDTHPDEVVVLFIEDKVDPTDTAEAFEKSGLLRYAYVHKSGDPFPTMRELIDSDRRLFVMAEEDSGSGTIPWYQQGFDVTMETPYTFHNENELAAKASCAPNRGGTGKPLFQLNNWVEHIPRSPRTADRVNSYDFLLRRARMCEKVRSALPNIVAVDFYNRGDLFGAVRTLNGIPADQQPQVRTTG